MLWAGFHFRAHRLIAKQTGQALASVRYFVFGPLELSASIAMYAIFLQDEQLSFERDERREMSSQRADRTRSIGPRSIGQCAAEKA